LNRTSQTRFKGKLKSKSLMIVLAVNMMLPVVTAFLVKGVIQTSLYSFLLLIFVVIILGVMNYFYVIAPFIYLEKIVNEHMKVFDLDLVRKSELGSEKTSLEQNFLDMLQIQKEIEIQKILAKDRIQSAELYALQTQINPHFLYNTLDSIRGLALTHDVKEISTMTEALSRLFRNIVAKEGQMLSLREELENVNHYLTIQDFRFNKRFTYEYTIPEKLLDQYQVPNMTLQPIVENAIMHGLEKKLGKGKITIGGYVTEKRLVLTITDDGVGIEEDKLNYLNERLQNYHSPIQKETMRYHQGIALLSINKQLKLKFGDQYGIYISSTPNLYTVTELVLPAISVAEHPLGGLL